MFSNIRTALFRGDEHVAFIHNNTIAYSLFLEIRVNCGYCYIVSAVDNSYHYYHYNGAIIIPDGWPKSVPLSYQSCLEILILKDRLEDSFNNAIGITYSYVEMDIPYTKYLSLSFHVFEHKNILKVGVCGIEICVSDSEELFNELGDKYGASILKQLYSNMVGRKVLRKSARNRV